MCTHAPMHPLLSAGTICPMRAAPRGPGCTSPCRTCPPTHAFIPTSPTACLPACAGAVVEHVAAKGPAGGGRGLPRGGLRLFLRAHPQPGKAGAGLGAPGGRQRGRLQVCVCPWGEREGGGRRGGREGSQSCSCLPACLLACPWVVRGCRACGLCLQEDDLGVGSDLAQQRCWRVHVTPTGQPTGNIPKQTNGRVPSAAAGVRACSPFCTHARELILPPAQPGRQAQDCHPRCRHPAAPQGAQGAGCAGVSRASCV